MKTNIRRLSNSFERGQPAVIRGARRDHFDAARRTARWPCARRAGGRLLLAGLCAALIAGGAAAAGMGKPIPTGQLFPNITGNDAITGRPVALHDLHGKVVIIYFWATWCGPCKVESPRLKALYDKHKDDGLAVLAVSNDRQVDALKRYVEQHKLPWPQIHDAKGELLGRFGVTGIPMFYILGRDGKVLAGGHQLAPIQGIVPWALKQPAPASQPAGEPSSDAKSNPAGPAPSAATQPAAAPAASSSASPSPSAPTSQPAAPRGSPVAP